MFELMNYSQLCRKILHINPNHWFLSVWFKYWILFIRIFDKLYIKFTTLIFPLNLGAAYQFENTSTRNGWHLKRPFSFKTRFWFPYISTRYKLRPFFVLKDEMFAKSESKVVSWMVWICELTVFRKGILLLSTSDEILKPPGNIFKSLWWYTFGHNYWSEWACYLAIFTPRAQVSQVIWLPLRQHDHSHYLRTDLFSETQEVLGDSPVISQYKYV